MKIAKIFFMVAFPALLHVVAFGQKKDTMFIKGDSITMKLTPKDSLSNAKKDSASKNTPVAKKRSKPARAALYSAIFPGMGQAFNKQYWKVPIAWAAVGIPTYAYFYNKTWYNKTRYALAVLANGSYTNADSFNRVDPKLKPFILNPDGTVYINGLANLQNYRNYFRQNEDYSLLFFLLFYALNIVDAVVDAHLKLFNVNGDLSLSIKPDIIEGSNASGLTFVLDIHKAKARPLIPIQ